jgi:hypothetical protein
VKRLKRELGKNNCAKRVKNTWRRQNTALVVMGKDVDGKQVMARVTTGMSLREWAREQVESPDYALLGQACASWLWAKTTAARTTLRQVGS